MLRHLSLVAVTTFAVSCAEAPEACDEPSSDLGTHVCAVGSACSVEFNEGTFTVSGELPDGVTVTANGLSGTPTEAGEWPLSIEITSTTGAEACEPVTGTATFAFSTVERECVSNDDCLVLRAGSFAPSACTASNDCTSEFDFCVAYLNGGRCVASADCAEGLDAVSFASIEGDVVRGCTTLDVRCGDNGLCG
jgi:hypothetical protein